MVNIWLLEDISSLLATGECVHHKHSLQHKLMFFAKKEPVIKNKKGAIVRESLPPPWDRVALVILEYFFSNDLVDGLRSFHLAFLNLPRRGKKINVPAILFMELERTVDDV